MMADAERKSTDDVDSCPGANGLADGHTEKEWAPIRPRDSPLLNAVSRTGASLRSVSRTRSQNGYGCGDESDQERNWEDGPGEKDPFEVDWENGEMDPLNPRRKSMLAKWAIVMICSTSSLCV